MGRSPCCSKIGLNRGSWTASEDKILSDYIHLHGEGKWRQLPIKAGLKRCGKSCRLRWLNYLKPDIKRGNISSDEEDLIIRLHKLLGNRWSLIAGRLPGRTDNEIKNYWNTTLTKKVHELQHINHNVHNSASNQSQQVLKRKDKDCAIQRDESNVVPTKAVRPQIIESTRAFEIEDPANPKPTESPFPFYHEDNNYINPSSFNDVNVGEGGPLSGLFNMDFMDSINLSDDMLSGSSTITSSPDMSKEILDYFSSIPEIGGEWLSSL